MVVHEREDFSKAFYSSRQWVNCRKKYAQSVGGLCERCYRKGIVNAGAEVHHKTRLTPDNINNPYITLNWDNLELLCVECHHDEHRRSEKRYTVLPDGTVLL